MKTIKSKQDFEKVFKSGKRINHPLVRLSVCKVDEGCATRVAFVAAKKLGNAPFRNRCKRILRAAVREVSFPPTGYEVILFSTRETPLASSPEVANTLQKLTRRFDK